MKMLPGRLGRPSGQQESNCRFFVSGPADTSASAMANTLSTANSQLNKGTKEQAYPDFFPAAQNDFAARLKWSVTAQYKDANHEPVVKIEGPLNILASAGQKIRLNGAVSDPDGNAISITWWQFRVGSFPDKVDISNPNLGAD